MSRTHHRRKSKRGSIRSIIKSMTWRWRVWNRRWNKLQDRMKPHGTRPCPECGAPDVAKCPCTPWCAAECAPE